MERTGRRFAAVAVASATVALTACVSPAGVPDRLRRGEARVTAAPSKEPRSSPQLRRPRWLGTRVLPRSSSGYGVALPTPPLLRNRRLPTVDVLPPPASDRFRAHARRVPPRVSARSTWSPRCPVALSDLRYLTASFWGFDGKPHRGEMLVHASAADAIVEVLRRLYEVRFPIEEMRVTSKGELDAPPTGDGNNTTSFVCRPARGSTTWSQHAYGLAVDINPFHNPYVDGEVVLPELASAYRNRSWRRPGMVLPGGPVVRAFTQIGWSWGGEWRSVKDWMHFSSTGR